MGLCLWNRRRNICLLMCRVFEANIIYCRLDEDSFASLTYDPESYDDMPTYPWNKDLDLNNFAREIDYYNDNLFNSLKKAICQKLGINDRRGGCEL